MKISIFGCGRWGSFIAWYLNHIGHEITLCGRKTSENLTKLINFRKNEFLELDKEISITYDDDYSVNNSDTIIISISAQSLRTFLNGIKHKIKNIRNKTFVLCMKGIEEKTGKRLSQVVKECLGNETKVAVWVGPGHVQDFLLGIPNCMVIDSEYENSKKLLVKEFSSNLIRFYYGNDIIGSEIGAAAKNVMGIAAGILDGIGYTSLKGALMSRGTREIARLIKSMGGNELSAYSLAHLGDYQATLFSPHSNNRKFGECLVTGQNYDKLAEGVATSHALLNLGANHNIELPITQAVYDTISSKISPKECISNLFLRSIKSEF